MDKLPWKVTAVEDIVNRKLLKEFKGERTGFIQVGPSKYFFPSKYAEELGSFYNFKPRQTDTWVVSFPRSGTTWTQEMVWLLSNNLDYKTAGNIPLPTRFPFLEFSACVNNDAKAEWLAELKESTDKQAALYEVSKSVVDELNAMTGPRFIKTHLPFSLLPSNLLECGAKIVYVARNPKDVAVSYYHLHRLIKTLDFVGDFGEFWDYFEKNLLLWSPYWSHVKEGWKMRNNPNVTFLFYEDMKKDLKSTIYLLSKFLNKEYNSESVEKLSEHLDIKNFRQNTSVNCEGLHDLGMLNNYSQRYVRTGEAGTWKQVFTKELNHRADHWIETNLKDTDLRFPMTTN